jgi:hypothetical protein
MANNLYNDLNNSDILYINILNMMYNDNLRIIHNLVDQNNEIRHQLINIFNERRNNNNNTNRNTNQNTNPIYNQTNNNRNNYSRIRQRSNTNNANNANNANNTNNRVIINDIPYILEEIQYISPTNNIQFENLNSETDRRRNNSLVSEFGRIFGSFLDPIIISPSQIQIEQATVNMMYNEISNPRNNSCPICLENFVENSRVTMISQCNHIFNTDSLMTWFNSSPRCPVCRYDIRNFNPTQNNDVSNNTIDNTNNNNSSDFNNNINNNTTNSTNTINSINTINSNNNNNTTNTSSSNRINSIRNINDQTIALLDNLILETFQDLSGNTSLEHFQPFLTYFSHNIR